MDLKKVLVLGLVVMTVLVFAEPAGAFLWPPAIGTCGLGGLFGPYGLFGAFGPYGIFGLSVPCGPFGAPFGVPFGGCGPGACGTGFGFPC